MSKKTEKFEYIKRKLQLISNTDFLAFINEAPIKEKERNLLVDIKNGFSLSVLSEKYGVSYSRIAQWKREIYEHLYDWEKSNIEIVQKSTQNNINIEKIINDKISQALNEKTKQLEQKEALLDALLEKEEKKRIQKKLRKFESQLNSRGTKKAEPTILIKNDSKKNENQEITITRKELKKKYIPMYVRGEITSKEICNILEITPARLSQMKKEYLHKGESYLSEHGNKHRIPTNVTPDEIKEKICTLYKEKYEFKSLKDFIIDLEDIYKIKISKSTVKKILEEKGIYFSYTERFIGISNEQIGTDFLSVMILMDETINKKELSVIEQFGLIELCELAFSKTYLTLNSFSKKIENKIYRTSYSCISHYIEDKIIDIQDEWNYWNKNHEHFSYVYNEQYRLKVISDIRNNYYFMFKKIENYIKETKKKLA